MNKSSRSNTKRQYIKSKIVKSVDNGIKLREIDTGVGLQRYAPPVIIILMLLAFYYSFFVLPNQPAWSWLKMRSAKDSSQISNETSCIEDSTKGCNIQDCNGTMTCKNEKWLSCRLTIICTPGSKASCIENACTTGYKVCNECGTDYETCIYD